MRCFNRPQNPWRQSAAFFLCWFSVHTAQAEEAWLQRSQAILQALEGQPRPDWLNGQAEQLDMKRQAQPVLEASQAIRAKALSTGSESHLPANLSSKPVTLLFVSFSLGESALKGIFEEASGREDVLLVFRGPKPGQKLPALMADLKRLLKGAEPLPNIVIDPTRFQRWSVASVPDIVVEQEGKSHLHVRGVSSLSWLDEQLKAGKLRATIARPGAVHSKCFLCIYLRRTSMNFIFGIILLAMFILALRVLWATAWQLLNALKHAAQGFQHYRAQRSARNRLPVVMPQIRHEVDWLAMSESVRMGIQTRNHAVNLEAVRLEAQLQAKLKTIEIYEADIQIAKLERELLKIKPVIENPEPEVKKPRRSKKQSVAVADAASQKISHQVSQLRAALKGNGLSVPVSESVRH